jgi:O-antigen ligase
MAVENIPSLRMRVAYMRYDWLQYQSDSGASYSDSERWVSLKTGWKIWEEHPALGVGAGDLQQEVRRVTTEVFPDYAATPLLPHNQWIHILASTGILGLLLSIPGFFALFAQKENRSNYLLLTFYAMAFLTFLIECTIENAIGVAWFLFFPLWFSGIRTK